MELGGLEADIRWADAVWTGEGRVDGTTGEGKAPESLRRAARRAGKPCVIFAGSLGEGAENLSRRGARIHWIGAGYSTDESRRRAKELLRMAAEREAALLIR
jgi:glycerate kinase